MTEYFVSLPRLFSATGSFARPGNTTAYAANDEVSDGVASPEVQVSNVADQPAVVTGGTIRTNDTGPGTAAAVFEVYVYNAAEAIGSDNAAFSHTRTGLVGILTGTFRAMSGGSFAELQPVGRPYLVAPPLSGLRTLRYVVKTLTVFTPSAQSTVFDVTLEGVLGRA